MRSASKSPSTPPINPSKSWRPASPTVPLTLSSRTPSSSANYAGLTATLYCLLGLFDVSLPTLYGEGRKAFRRLQEEIMKTTSDSSLFAWGEKTFTGISLDDYTPGLCAPTPEYFWSSVDVQHCQLSSEMELAAEELVVPRGRPRRIRFYKIASFTPPLTDIYRGIVIPQPKRTK